MILMLDNFDSFTYNLVQYLGELGAEPEVFRNNAITIAEIEQRGYEGIVISPGPGTPEDAGISIQVIRHFAGKIPILGVCLGHQAIGEAFGGRVVRAPRPIHGKASAVRHTNEGVFKGLDSRIEVGRYHSLIVERDSLPSDLKVTAEAEDGTIMGLRHRSLAVEGVQFHPESILTSCGMQMLHSFVASTRYKAAMV